MQRKIRTVAVEPSDVQPGHIVHTVTCGSERIVTTLDLNGWAALMRSILLAGQTAFGDAAQAAMCDAIAADFATENQPKE